MVVVGRYVADAAWLALYTRACAWRLFLRPARRQYELQESPSGDTPQGPARCKLVRARSCPELRCTRAHAWRCFTHLHWPSHSAVAPVPQVYRGARHPQLHLRAGGVQRGAAPPSAPPACSLTPGWRVRHQASNATSQLSLSQNALLLDLLLTPGPPSPYLKPHACVGQGLRRQVQPRRPILGVMCEPPASCIKSTTFPLSPQFVLSHAARHTSHVTRQDGTSPGQQGRLTCAVQCDDAASAH